MTIQTLDPNVLEEIKTKIDIADLISRSGLTVVGRGRILTTAEHDSLKIFTDNNSWTWYSQAGRNGKALGGSTIDWYVHHNNCSEGEAIRALQAMLDNMPLPAPVAKRAPVFKAPVKQPADWQRDARNIVEHAQWRLMDDNDAGTRTARAYLDRRGLTPDTWLVFKLGYAPRVAIPGTEGKERAPAISMPWYRAGQLVGVRYRFLEKQGDYKQTALAGSSFSGVLYGGPALATGIAELSTLLICEGEMNACSIWQVSRDTHLDVLSMGSESATITPAMVEHTQKYATVLTWLDQEDYVKRAMEVLPGAYGVKSPGGKDANDLLQAGMLSGFLAMHRFQAAKNRHEQQRLLWDLSDAARLPGGVDDVMASVIADIAKTIK